MNKKKGMLATAILMGCGATALGCHAGAGTYVETQSAVVYDRSPTLVAVEPGLWVVSDQPTAVYYVGDSYWTCRGDTWYRSSSWDRGWVSVDVTIVPVTIVHRDSTRYVYYRSYRGVRTGVLPYREAPGVRRGQVGHDHRNEMGSTWRGRGNPHRGHGHER